MLFSAIPFYKAEDLTALSGIHLQKRQDNQYLRKEKVEDNLQSPIDIFF